MTRRETTIEDLPGEIIEQFIRRETLPSTTLTSRAFYQSTKDPYLKEICSRPITFNEIEKYLKGVPKNLGEPRSSVRDLGPVVAGAQVPNIFGFYGYRPDMDLMNWGVHIFKLMINNRADNKYIDTHYSIHTKSGLTSNPDFDGYTPDLQNAINEYGTIYIPTLIYVYPDSYDRLEYVELKKMVPKLREMFTEPRKETSFSDPTIPIIDLLSQYRILSNRLGCISRKSDYAKDRVLQELDEIYDNYVNNYNINNLIATWAFLFSPE